MEDTARNAGGKLGEYAYSGRSADRSASDLVRDIISNAQEMVRSEVRLAQAEFREEAAKTLSGAKKMAIAAGAGLFALTFVLWSVAMLLARFLPDWVATLLVGLALGGVAGVLYSNARGKVQTPKLDKTTDNIKENVEWTINQTKS
jgi:uncharacterized membrane protein YqjE